MSKFSKEQLLVALGYAGSPNYREMSGESDPLTAPLFRAAYKAGAIGAYVFHTSNDDKVLPVKPAVYIAEVSTPEEARAIHRNIWNLGSAPFLIVILPGQIRVYTGFDYSQKNADRGLISVIELLSGVDLKEVLSDYKSDSIDSGRLWAQQARNLTQDNRVNVHLLRNLRLLEEGLVSQGLDIPVAHALIGKYVYIRYLKDRNILSSQWLEENNIDLNSILGRSATLSGLRKLISVLDERFNGQIFPFPLYGKRAPNSEQLSLVAAAFKGDDVISGQLHLDFEPYDFSYIPVETLSSIYEQFLQLQGKGRDIGAIYTPEYLADYLIAELDQVKPLEKGIKILDPSCGSGIFLVLAYRKLIEMELSTRPDQKLRPTELRDILTKSIFGVERSKDACFVTELSLILTMLNYISPPDLHQNKQFQFPVLHNKQIFEADFFDDSSIFSQKNGSYDWIIGNPPWIEPNKGDNDEHHVLTWIEKKQKQSGKLVAGNRVAEAFSWRVSDFLSEGGCVGLILQATSLFNHESKIYREKFFTENEVLRITNFTNLAYILFAGRAKDPAATIVYRAAQPNREKASIIHFGPFVINQALSEYWKNLKQKKRSSWMLTINEDEISTIDPCEAETGESVIWKVALWGSHRDLKALQRIQRLLPVTLYDLMLEKGWQFHQGLTLRAHPSSDAKSIDDIVHVPVLEGRKYFDAKAMNASHNRFHISPDVLKTIPSDRCYISKRGGKKSLTEGGVAQLLFNAMYCVFSDQDFILRNPDKRLAAPLGDADELRALSVYFNSSIAQFYLFFRSAIWGVSRNRIYPKDIKQIPVPHLTTNQIERLATLQKKLAIMEETTDLSDKATEIQDLIDKEVESVINLPSTIWTSVKGFIKVRLSLNHGKLDGAAGQPPLPDDLIEYGQLLRDQLDKFNKGRVYHKVSFASSPGQELLICTVEVTYALKPLEVSIDINNGKMSESLNWLNKKLRQQFSQWIYIQRSLRIFDGPKVYLCKGSRLIDWTKSQALNDSDDLIAEVLFNRDIHQGGMVNGAS